MAQSLSSLSSWGPFAIRHSVLTGPGVTWLFMMKLKGFSQAWSGLDSGDFSPMLERHLGTWQKARVEREGYSSPLPGCSAIMRNVPEAGVGRERAALQSNKIIKHN